MRYRMTGALLIGALLLACGGDRAEDAAPGVQDTAATATRAMGAEGSVFVDEVAAPATVVFVGEDSTVVPEAWGSATFVPMSTFSVERDGIPNEFPRADSMARMLERAGVSGDRVVIVGAPIPAGRGFAAFDYLGLGDRAAILDGGPGALGSGAVAGAAGAPAPGADAAGGAEPEADVRADMIVDAEWVHARLDDPSVAILDARPPAQFSGEVPGEGIDRPGHIPGAHNVFWQTLVESEADPRLKAEAELRRIFEEAGAEPGDTVVAYCRTGGQGSFLYSVARHLGYDVRLYDGSYIDWSRTEYPVER